MQVLNDLLFWLHLMALALGGVATFGVPLLSARLAGTDPAARPVLVAAIQQFSRIGSAAVGLLIVTGAILVYSKYGGPGGMDTLFWLKMVLVVALIAVVLVNKRLGARARAGDAAAAARAAVLARVGMALLAAVVLAAVAAFG